MEGRPACAAPRARGLTPWRAAFAIGVTTVGAIACVKVPSDVRATFAQVGENEQTNYQRKHDAKYPRRFLDWLDGSADASDDAGEAPPPPHDSLHFTNIANASMTRVDASVAPASPLRALDGGAS